MSHREDCPDEWEARAAGRRDAQSYGYSRASRWEDCEDAQSAYRRGFYAEEDRIREEREQEHRRQMAEQSEAEEARYWADVAAEEAERFAAEQPGTERSGVNQTNLPQTEKGS